MIETREITSNPALFQESRANIYFEWGTHLSFADYLELENHLMETLQKNSLKYRVFAIVDSQRSSNDANANAEVNVTGNQDADVDAGLAAVSAGDAGSMSHSTPRNKWHPVVFASCDVISRQLYHGWGKYTTDHCINKVYVRPEYRNQGYAHKLLQQVTSLFNVHDNQVSLWSDIGDYYARFGFVFPPDIPGEPNWMNSIICQPTERKPSDCELLNMLSTKRQIIGEHQRLLIRITDAMRYDCEDTIKLRHVVPHIGLYERFYSRALLTAEKMGICAPTIFAARTSDGHGWISWTYMFEEHKLLILGAFGSANEIAILMVAAASVAYEYDLQVELYETSIITPDADIEEIATAMEAHNLDSVISERDSSLPMSLGTEIWIRPGGYAWC